MVVETAERPGSAFPAPAAIPHLVWLLLWSIATFFAAIAAWLAALATGSVPAALHRFLAAYVRYAVHVQAYLYVVGRRFPGFTGQPGSYGIDLEIDPPQRQSRWLTFFRLFLAFPAPLSRRPAARGLVAGSPRGAHSRAVTCLRGSATSGQRASATRSRRRRTCCS
jgi:hypothetical protein